MKLLNKVVLVTGAASAVGGAFCALAEKEGAILLKRDGFIESAAPCKALIEEAEGKYGRVDVVVNCTPESSPLLPVSATPDELYEETVMQCQTGVFYMCREAFTLFREQGFGVGVNVGSFLGLGGAGGAAYEMAQHGLVGLTRNIALQYAGDPAIRCNVVCSGLLSDPDGSSDPDYAAFERRKNKSFVPNVEAEEVAKAVLFLASDDSARINGQFLQVDAGKYFKEV